VHETVLEPNAMPHPPHRHVHEEMFLISTGTLDVTISGKSTKLSAGSAVYVASNEEHGIRNTGATPAQYIVVALGRDAS
jgi:mannose-6-phosphate isomerase-like protein (cupin superfamily)